MTLRTRILRGHEVSDALEDLARLRMTVFREWPYLYDGDLDYERRYMAGYGDNPRAVLVGAWDGERLVGAATGMPIEDHGVGLADAFEGLRLPLDKVFYCAESVLLPEWRGQGAGQAFFTAREDHARALGRRWSTFCAVERPSDHPARSESYRSPEALWRRHGYAPLPGVRTQFFWKDVGDAEETEKTLHFWIKPL